MKEFNNIRELVEFTSQKFSQNTAFKIKNKVGKEVSYRNVTYTDLMDDIRALGKYFLFHGLDKKRISVVGKNCYEWMLVFLSVLSVNGIIIPIDKDLSKELAEGQLKDSEADALFYVGDFTEIFAENKNFLKVCMADDTFSKMLEEGRNLDNDADFDSIKVDSDKMSILLFTSGTSAASKAVMLSQRNITSDIYGMSLWEDFKETDVNLAILPFHHTFGMTQIVIFLSHGICNVFCEGLRIAKALNEYKVTILVAVPRITDEIYAKSIRTLEKRNKLKSVNRAIAFSGALKKIGIDIRRKLMKPLIDAMGGALRMLIIGAAPANPDVIKWFNAIGVLTVQGYGLTETSPCVSAENEKNMRRGSVGKAIPGVDVKINEPDSDQIGEIIVKGKNVMLGYYNDEEKSHNVLKDGYFYTGDMGYIDKDGYIFITGRKKNVIVQGNGKNIYPEELEMMLSKSGYVKECIVYNKRENDKDYICAKIVYDSDLNEDEIRPEIEKHINKINSDLPMYKQIKTYELTDKEMEKTSTLKIKRY